MIARARRRYLDILASVYIYNEHRGYSSIDRVLAAVRSKYPDDTGFIRKIEKHRRDERQHYLMFRRYFENRGEMPYRVDRTCGHIDRLIRLTFGCGIDELDAEAVINREDLFERLNSRGPIRRVLRLWSEKALTRASVNNWSAGLTQRAPPT